VARKANRSSGKAAVGSNRRAAKKFGGKTDFGIAQKPSLREYSRRKSRETKFQPAASHQRDTRQERGSVQSARVSGVGKSNAGPGGSSGGDLDPDVIGVGTGRGLAQSGPDQNVSGPESTTGGSEEFASGPAARGTSQKRSRRKPPK